MMRMPQWLTASLRPVSQHFEAIPQASVDTLIAAGDVYYCAGGLMVEHPLVSPHVLSIDGTMDSVMGLKKDTVTRLIECAMAARAEQAT